MRTWCLIYCKSVPIPLLVGYIAGDADHAANISIAISSERIDSVLRVKCVAAKLPFPLYGSVESNGGAFVVPLHDYHDFLLFEQEYGVRPLYKQ